jgi:hypothetical protein
MHNCPVFNAFPNSVGAIIPARKLVFLLVPHIESIVLLLYYSLEAYNRAIF